MPLCFTSQIHVHQMDKWLHIYKSIIIRLLGKFVNIRLFHGHPFCIMMSSALILWCSIYILYVYFFLKINKLNQHFILVDIPMVCPKLPWHSLVSVSVFLLWVRIAKSSLQVGLLQMCWYFTQSTQTNKHHIRSGRTLIDWCWSSNSLADALIGSK